MSRGLAVLAWLITAVASGLGWWQANRPVAVPEPPGDRLPCVSYTPFRDGQSPHQESLVVPPSFIDEDFRLLAGRVSCVRTYAVDQGLDAVPELARKHGLQVLLGIWIGRERDKNARQVECAIALANEHRDVVRAVVVGNEVLLRRDQPAEALREIIRRVKRSVPVPVTYADVWEFWERNAAIAEDVDIVTIHLLPYWEDEPIGLHEGAIDHVRTIWRRMAAHFPGKPILVGEVGWPSEGRMREGALPSRVNQAWFVRGILAAAAAERIDINLIEAFDQPWKRVQEGTVGGHWGVYTTARAVKFPIHGPVVEDPAWPLLAGAGMAIATAALAFAAWRRRRRGFGSWLGLAAVVQAGAAAFVLAGDRVLLTSWSIGDWFVAVAVLGGGLWLALAALRLHVTGGGAVPAGSLAVLEALAARPFSVLTQAGPRLGLLRLASLFGAAATMACLVIDARYRGFPVAYYALPAIALAVFAVAGAPRDTGGARRIDGFLAILLAAGAVAVAIKEGWENHQSLGWVVLGCALAALALWRGPQRGARVSVNDSMSASTSAGAARLGL